MNEIRYVIYHSREWENLVVCSGNFSNPRYGWVTWSVEIVGEVEIAKMIWTRL
jgi:hypothetical protein